MAASSEVCSRTFFSLSSGQPPRFIIAGQPQVGELVGQPQVGPVQATLLYCGQHPCTCTRRAGYSSPLGLAPLEAPPNDVRLPLGI